MSKQAGMMMEIEKCVLSELWYTSFVIYQTRNDKLSLQKCDTDTVDFIDSEATIKTLIHSQHKHQYQWITYVFLNKLIGDIASNVKENVQKQCNRLQMMHALQLCKDASNHIQQKLLLLYETHSEHEANEIIRKMYQECQTFYKRNMLKNTGLMCWITNELLNSKQFSSTLCALQNLYIINLKEVLQCALISEDINYQRKNIADYFGCILCILSKMKVNEPGDTSFSTFIYPALRKVFNDAKDVELSLYCRKDKVFFDEWCNFMDKEYGYFDATDNLQSILKIQKNMFYHNVNSQVSLNRNRLIERTAKTKMHWLTDILNICYILIMNEEYNVVSSILSHQLLNSFWFVLLLKVLSENNEQGGECLDVQRSTSIRNSVKFLIDKCNLDKTNDLALRKLHAILNKHAKIIECILNWKEEHSLITDSNKQEEKTRQNADGETVSVKHMFNLLQRYSTLSMLKTIINIHEQDHDRIQSTLRELDEPVNIFLAYLSILNALKAIMLCELYNTKQKQIENYFYKMKYYLNTLYPLSLRLYVIENIFALLFLRYEDFSDTQSSSDDEGASTSDEKTTSKNKPAEQYSTGFICNKYAVRDLLLYLKESVLDAGMEFVRWKSEMGLTKEMEQVQKSISTMSTAIADARWRLELYTNSQFVENINCADDGSYGVNTTNKSKTQLEKLGPLNKVKDSSFFYYEDSTSDDARTKSDSSSESGLVSNNFKRKKRAKTISLTIDGGGLKDSQKQCLINFMLASKESLVTQCLWKGNYIRAQEVIEMSDMKSTQLNAEVRFSKALYAFKQDLYKYVGTLEHCVELSDNTQCSTLENIRLAAQEGVQTCRHTSKLETFLAAQEVHLRMLNMNVYNSNEMLTLCALDLALTMSQFCSISNNICDVAMKYLKLCKTFENTEYEHFFFKVYQALYENKGELPLSSILCDAKVPLSVKECKEKSEFWAELRSRHRNFSELQKNKEIKERPKDNYLTDLKILSKVSGVCSSTEKYLQNVCSHLQLLNTIVPTDVDARTASDLLRIPLHYYFGHQIFDLQLEPHKLEEIAQNLQVNLVYSILANSCPRLSSEQAVRYNVHSANNGCTILNKNFEASNTDSVVQGPNQCVAEILSELLKVLENLSLGQCILNRRNCASITQHPEIEAVLSKTSRLVTLDLSELSVDDETLTFFLNTWNIMFIHAYLVTWADQPLTNDLWHAISMMSMGYMIGDLGFVTLAALRPKLLGNIMSDNTFFIHIEELNEPAWQDLDIVHDPRLAFAMANEFYGTPCIRVCHANTLNEYLRNAFHEYLDYYSLPYKRQWDGEEPRTIILPDLVQKYHDFVLQSCKSDTIGDIAGAETFSIEDYFNTSNENVSIQYSTSAYTYEIVLKYPKELETQQQSKIDDTSKWKIRSIRPNLLQYLEGHCWVVSYLLQRIHNEHPTILENNCDNLRRTACFENLLNSSWTTRMKSLHDDNQALAAIQERTPPQKLWSHFETALKNNEWHNCLDLINALPDDIYVRNTEVQYLKDKILSQVVSVKGTIPNLEVLQCLYQIKDVYALAQTVLLNLNKWHVQICEYALLHTLHHADSYKLPAHCKLRMRETLHRVLIFHKMLPYCVNKPSGTWYDVAYCTEKVDPFQIIQALTNADKFELCLEWLECQAFPLEIQSSVTQDFLIGLLKTESQDFKHASKLLQVLPLGQSVKMCKGVLKKLESIDALQFVANYLLEHCRATETIKYRRTLVGIDVLRMLEAKERPLYIHLINEPLLMLEQLLMNCKFESIQKILKVISDKLEQVGISINDFDKIIRFYAQKSLDFRVCLQRDGIESKPKNVQHSISDTENDDFIMPAVVPTKEEWVPNDKARKCSCCKAVIFSMFNRRHHCRRCGRVVCAVCSQHRMQVPGYPPSVSVRVCDDCKRQTAQQIRAVQGTPSTPNSEMFDYWRLTKDQTHNQTIREEFSFEYAPNISLCLAILNLHSDHKAYTSFLLDRCDEMKRLLQPVGGGKVNPEIDHTVILKMIRWLLVAVKVKCAKLGLNTGLAHCDRFLSQVDLIGTLVQSDCLDLIPSDNLDEHTLRKLRDLLIEKEQWKLALDVSTKAGLDTQGVWATWGKACLKMGYFDQARDKFFHCLDKILYEDFEDWVLLSYPKESSPAKSTITDDKYSTPRAESETKIYDANLRKPEFTKCRPLKDPPLLTEILQILENLSVHKQHVQYSQQQKYSATQEILNTFGNLRITGQTQFSMKNASATSENIYNQESLYYLLTYGSYNSILEFFLRNEEFNKCLAFVLENDLEPELFFNAIYLRCLRNGNVEKLHEAMKNEDTSLLTWKKYLICVCHNLERRQYLHILYQLQLFMKDSVRAAMTCIRFYTRDATDYTDLCSRGHFLIDAQKHLESELQIESLSRKRRKSTSSLQSAQAILTMEMEPLEIDRHINTICRQMEIAKFLAHSEKEERAPLQFLNLFPDMDYNGQQSPELPTLFGNQQQKINLAVLGILCGRNIEEGFGMAFRVMQDYNLPQQKVYSLAGHVLALKNNIPAIEQLIKCCHTSGTPNSYVISDFVLTHCVKLLLNRFYSEPGLISKGNIDMLVKLITDVELKINAYIECKQLKAAYLVAVKYARTQDIKKILKEAERLGQTAIKAICVKWLQRESKS